MSEPATPSERSVLHHIPNLLCVFRIALVPPVLWLMTEGRFALALGLVFIAGFSDGLDGFLAKRFNWRTQLGAILDPLADKLLLVGVFATLGWLGLLPAWLVFLAIVRDAVIILGAIAYRTLIGPVQGRPSLLSKANTGVQLLLALSVMSTAAFSLPGQALVVVLGAIMFVTALTSGADYIWTWSRKALAARGAIA